tara:strand:- start:3875 stop:5857 length:1983 start_codon:yes stop_codon:yes gene_type:complete
MIKVAGRQELPIAESIMRRIHDEDPSYWPHGLSTDQFNGGLYLMQKAANSEPVGFVGWQNFDEGGRKVGYYAVGVLPAYRQQGFAKQAVSQVIREIGHSCDEVKAMVMKHNEPSKALARSLRIPVLEKIAGGAKQQILGSLLGGLGTAAFFDQTADPSRSVKSTGQPQTWDKERGLMGGLNFLLGALGGHRLSQGHISGLAPIALAPTKDLAIKGVGSLYKIDDAAEEAAKKFFVERALLENPTPGDDAPTWAEKVPTGVWAGAGALGAGGLGLLLYNAKRNADHRKEELAQAGGGRVKITLPTQEKGDSETEVDLPFEDMNFSRALKARLKRDTKRRLNAGTMARTRHRKPVEKSASMPARIASLVDELGMYKASAGPAQQTVPTPPQLGQNPAMRMQQQAATANSIQPSTDANPQIMQAQQAAAQAEQSAAAQAAQMEQQAQTAQMEQQRAFSEQMMKSDQEKEVLKLQLEKEKVLKELNAAKGKAEADAEAGEGTALQRLASSRIGRLQRRLGLGKSAYRDPQPSGFPSTDPGGPVIPGTPGTLDPRTGLPIGGRGVMDPATGLPTPQEPLYLRPHAVQRINKAPVGTTGIAPIGVYRHSYGPIGDTLYDFFRNKLMAPRPPKPSPISRSSMINNPDAMGMISQLYQSGGSLMGGAQ